ncbi:hydroxymethylbilane synthase [Thermocrinis minervae]|uniref:Porphobilinogen deaminase n=1 Tax=Thermocrinis minervae TaxID=381751 RepID=A0A1M6SQI1_9AQUI|nr:hydroxymethylbilane synthase [Thermocrinis minervae]SHK46897.1 hydroxymethylbilane synthase [Thermocrinis minervae]
MHLRLGTRKSKLALWQANYVKSLLEKEGHTVEIVTITTSGDKIKDVPLAKIGGKGLFVKEIEEALLEGRIDLAVHSLKDVPTVLPEGLEICCVTKREDPYDVLISKNSQKLEDLPPGSVVGTSSLRRKVQILRRRPDLKVEVLRGNVDTRIRKLEEGLYDSIVLAYAGVKRMGYEHMITQILDFIPAVGQGSLAIEVRKEDKELKKILSVLNHEESMICAKAERAFLKTLEGGCQVPMGAFAKLEGDKLIIRGFISDLEGNKFIESYKEGKPEEAESVGEALAKDLLSMGGEEILREIYS